MYASSDDPNHQMTARTLASALQGQVPPGIDPGKFFEELVRIALLRATGQDKNIPLK